MVPVASCRLDRPHEQPQGQRDHSPQGATGVVTAVLGTPVAFFLFAMGLMVDERLMYPLATLAVSVATGLIASWASGWLSRADLGSDINAVVGPNLALGVVPAAFVVAFPVVSIPLVFLMAAVLVYTTVTATRLTFKYRVLRTPARRRLGVTVAWLLKTAALITIVLLVASRFGLTGA